MTRTRTVLVVGGGVAGNGLTVLLRRAGIAVDLVEAKEDWQATTGSGITVQGNALRVLREVGVLDQVLARGFSTDGLTVNTPAGEELFTQRDVRTGGADLPATLGMQRPALQQILIEAVRASGARIRLGRTVASLTQDAAGVAAAFSDGTTGRYDLVVGAGARPEGLTRTQIAYGGAAYIAGLCPTSGTTLYAYLVEDNRDRAGIDPGSYAEQMRALSADYGGFWPEVRAAFTDPEQVNYTWFDRHLVEGAWHRGRVVLVGDAAHACPPTLAQGAAMSLEDVSVLAELLTSADSWDDALFTAYYERRIPRVRTVVDASVQLGQWQLDRVRDADMPGLMGRVMSVLSEAP